MSWYDLVAAFVFQLALRDAGKGEGGSGNAEATYTQLVLEGGGESDERARVMRNCVNIMPGIEQHITRSLENGHPRVLWQAKAQRGTGREVVGETARSFAGPVTLSGQSTSPNGPGSFVPTGTAMPTPQRNAKKPFSPRTPYIPPSQSPNSPRGSTPQPPLNPTCPPSHLPLRTRMAAS